MERSPVTNGPSILRHSLEQTDAGLEDLRSEVAWESPLRSTWIVQGGEVAIDGADVWGWPMAHLHVPD